MNYEYKYHKYKKKYIELKELDEFDNLTMKYQVGA